MKRHYIFLLPCIISVCLIGCNTEHPCTVNVSQALNVVHRSTPQKTYSSTFDLNESSISEGSNWINGKTVGIDWMDVKTVDGVAKGNPNYPDWWRDSTALLTGSWGTEQTVQGTIWCHPKTSDEHMEIEARLRSSLSAHYNKGYEVTFNCNKSSTAYMYIVRWNGAEKDFTILAQQTGKSWGVGNGDVVKASIMGNVISVYVNGIQRMQTTDNTYKNGSPGIGFDHNLKDSNEDFGLTDISVLTTGIDIGRTFQNQK